MLVSVEAVSHSGALLITTIPISKAIAPNFRSDVVMLMALAGLS